MKEKYQQEIELIASLPPDIKQQVIKNMGSNFRTECEKYFNQVEQWVFSWSQPQVLSILQREVFAKDRQQLESILQQSKQSMVQGYKGLVEGRMPAPFSELEKLLSIMHHEMLLVKFILQ